MNFYIHNFVFSFSDSGLTKPVRSLGGATLDGRICKVLFELLTVEQKPS